MSTSSENSSSSLPTSGGAQNVVDDIARYVEYGTSSMPPTVGLNSLISCECTKTMPTQQQRELPDDLNLDLDFMDFPIEFDPFLFSAADTLASLESLTHEMNGPCANAFVDAPSLILPSDIDNFLTFPSMNNLPMDGDVSSRDSPPGSNSSFSASSSMSTPGPSCVPHVQEPPLCQLSDVYSRTLTDKFMEDIATKAKYLAGVTKASAQGSDLTSNSDVNSPQTCAQMQCDNTPDTCNISTQASPGFTSTLATQTSSANHPDATTQTRIPHAAVGRRYRREVRARIQTLFDAVPAIRVLERKGGNRIAKTFLKAGTRIIGVNADANLRDEDVVDERGYIDGVKIPSKGSKAVMVSKVVEYIQVLKRRETRLKREQEGLKTLMRSLAGGHELVQQWESLWREQFGGAEKDELGGEEDEPEGGDCTDEEHDDSDMIPGRKRKRGPSDAPSTARVKTKKASKSNNLPSSRIAQVKKPVPIMPAQTSDIIESQPEKKKRGRPRKVMPPPLPATNALVQNYLAVQQSKEQQHKTTKDVQTQDIKTVVNSSEAKNGESALTHKSQPLPGQQYLLAVFGMFLLYKAPLSFNTPYSWESRPIHEHYGSVLNEAHPETGLIQRGNIQPTAQPYHWVAVVQLVCSIILAVLLVFILVPILIRFACRIGRKPFALVSAISSISVLTDRNYESSRDTEHKEAIRWLSSALRKGPSLVPTAEAEWYRKVLGLRPGLPGLVSMLLRQVCSPVSSHPCSQLEMERRMLERRVSIRFTDLVALDANASSTTRIQTFLYTFNFSHDFSTSATDMATLALVIRPLWHSKAVELWAYAQGRAHGGGPFPSHIYRLEELLVLENMTVDDAASKIEELDVFHRESGTGDGSGGSEPSGPLAVLAREFDYLKESNTRGGYGSGDADGGFSSSEGKTHDSDQGQESDSSSGDTDALDTSDSPTSESAGLWN